MMFCASYLVVCHGGKWFHEPVQLSRQKVHKVFPLPEVLFSLVTPAVQRDTWQTKLILRQSILECTLYV